MTDEASPLASPAARADRRDCLRCGAEAIPLGVQQLQVGRPGGGMLAGLIGQGEGLLDVEVLVCDTCRHIERRAADSWYRD